MPANHRLHSIWLARYLPNGSDQLFIISFIYYRASAIAMQTLY